MTTISAMTPQAVEKRLKKRIRELEELVHELTPRKTQHTPGPWEYRPIKNRVAAIILGSKEIGNTAPEIFAGKLVVARAYDPHRLSEGEANARLIAAAPRLLEALVSLVQFLDTCPESFDAAHHSEVFRLKRAQAAIERATE